MRLLKYVAAPTNPGLIGLLILWATPSAAGPRSLLIVSGLQILGSVASGSWYFWDANLSFGMIGGFTLVSWGTPLKPDSRDPETETGKLETEKRVHRRHDTLETGLHIILRSLVSPSREAADFHCDFFENL